jgi:mannosylglucosylglycerate synthase
VKIGFVATRLAGTDGVSLEAAKLASILQGMGHGVAACAGEVAGWGREAVLIPEMHFADSRARAVHDGAFLGIDPVDVRGRIGDQAALLHEGIADFIAQHRVELLVVENALAIPMHLPLGVALCDLIEATGIPTVAHHHDFYWERERFSRCAVPEVLDRCFPPDLPSIRHVVINSLARAALEERRGIASRILPNLLDFASVPRCRSRGDRVRGEFGIGPGERIILQPTRVVPRKRIEVAIDLVRRLQRVDRERRYHLLITHGATDEGVAYLERLRAQANRDGVKLLFAPERFVAAGDEGGPDSMRFSLQDAYEAADFVTYPSQIEGFGNAFLEAIYYRRPLLVNRYPVYIADIEPLGFRVVPIDGDLTDEAVAAVRDILADPARERGMTDHNYALAAKHFSFDAGRCCMETVLADLARPAALD